MEWWIKIKNFFLNLFYEPPEVPDEPQDGEGDGKPVIDGPEPPLPGREEEKLTPDSVVVFVPAAFEDVRQLRDYMRDVKVIVLDLTQLTYEERTMFLDFIWGMVKAANGHFTVLEPEENGYALITSRPECEIVVREVQPEAYGEEEVIQ